MLRFLLFGLVIVPPVLGAAACYVSYEYSYSTAIEAVATAAAAASDSTAAMLDEYVLIAARMNDLLGTKNPEQIYADERQLHDAMGRQIANRREIAAAWVRDATGRELVSARVYPVNRTLDESGREDFRALRDTNAQMFIWILRAHGLNSKTLERYVTVGIGRALPDGRFNGVVIVAVAGSYFSSSYKPLRGSPDDTIDLVKNDGTILAQFPSGETDPPPLPAPLLTKAITAGGETGIAERGTPFDSAGRIVAARRVANYPVYVAVERSKAAIAGAWLRSNAAAILIGVAATLALIALTRMALRHARREALALARAGEASADRAALEVRLHRTQRLEGIARLATGMASEFDRLLSNSEAHIERLEGSFEDCEASQKNLVAALKHNRAQASALIKRLLGYARREPIKPRPIDINNVLVQTLEQARQFTDSITREFRPQNDLWPSCVDPDQLAITVLTLMFNARDVFAETDKQTIVTMNTRVDRADSTELQGPEPGEYVVLLIESSRQEIPGEPVRAQPPAPPAIGKDGWPSLSLVHELIHGAGGYWTVSREPTQEATILIYFPRYLADSDKAEHDPIRAQSGASTSTN
jgi:signal transduction histidine kinase